VAVFDVFVPRLVGATFSSVCALLMFGCHSTILSRFAL
jgi:hypothetical protein